MELTRKKYSHYSKEFKLQVVSEYLQGARLSDLMRKYSINGYSTILPWIRIFAGKPIVHKMKKEESEKEIEKLRRELELKESELQFEKDRNHALNTMIDIAEEELKIEIRKKSGAKQ
jgi:transposase